MNSFARFSLRLSLSAMTMIVFYPALLDAHAQAEKIPPFKKVVLVLFENEDIGEPLSQPFFSKLAKEGALLTNYRAIAHPSQPNYIALTSGDTQGVEDDRNHDLDVRHLGNLLEEKGKTWKSYAENYPGGCFSGAKNGLYMRKHAPFISYTNVATTQRCANIVEASQFEKDVKNNSLPNFSFYTPNMDDDVHDTNIAFGEAWFKKKFEPLLKLPGFKDVLLIVTFDENDGRDLNVVYTVLYGRGIKPGTVSRQLYTHYSLLHTIETGFALGDLGKKDAHASVISDVWQKEVSQKPNR